MSLASLRRALLASTVLAALWVGVYGGGRWLGGCAVVACEHDLGACKPARWRKSACCLK